MPRLARRRRLSRFAVHFRRRGRVVTEPDNRAAGTTLARVSTTTAAAQALAAAIPAAWRPSLADATAAQSFVDLAEFLRTERLRTTVYPPPNLVFNALRLTSPDAVRAVILGQDPYHGRGQAQGLAFSVSNRCAPPPSLRNILRELPDGNVGPSLEPWARRGVLLLNTVLTVERGIAGSHQGRGWEPFTDAIIAAVGARPGPIAFLLWGRAAQAKASLIDRDRHAVVESGHPSPLSVRYFRGRAGFDQANDELQRRHASTIDWSLG